MIMTMTMMMTTMTIDDGDDDDDDDEKDLEWEKQFNAVTKALLRCNVQCRLTLPSLYRDHVIMI